MAEFYVQDTRSVVGNSAYWWRLNRRGYTCDLKQAGRFNEKEARSIERMRGTDRAIPCDLVDAIAESHVDLHRLSATTAALAAGAGEGEEGGGRG